MRITLDDLPAKARRAFALTLYRSKECTTSKPDLQLKQDIEDELRWDPMINAAQIDLALIWVAHRSVGPR